MSQQAIFEYRDMTGFIQGLTFPQYDLVNMIPKARTDAETFSWDIVYPHSEIDTNFVDQRGAARRADHTTREKKTASLFTDFWFKTLNAGEIANRRRLGSNERDDGGQQYLDAESKELADRFGAYKTQYMIAQALAGTLNFQVNGVAKTFDYELPSSHSPTASTSWATTTTNIISDLTTWRRVVSTDSGKEVKFALCNQKTMDYVLRNDDVMNSVGQTGYAVQAMQSRIYQGLLGLTWIVIDDRYGNSGATTFNTQFILDDKLILMPPMTEDWIQLYEGLGRYPNAGLTGFEEKFGPVSWTRAQDSPVGVTLYFMYSRGVAMKHNRAWMYCDVTP